MRQLLKMTVFVFLLSLTGLASVQTGALSATGFLAGGVEVLDGAAMMVTGSVAGSIVAAQGSVLAPGMSIGELTVLGDADINGAWDVEYDGTDPEDNPIDRLMVSGGLDIDGADDRRARSFAGDWFPSGGRNRRPLKVFTERDREDVGCSTIRKGETRRSKPQCV
jgi:hypothetical protein